MTAPVRTLLATSLILVLSALGAAQAQVMPTKTQDFINSWGATQAPNDPWTNMQALGIKNWRAPCDAFPTSILNGGGGGVCFLDYTGDSIARVISNVKSMLSAHPGSIKAVEGPNEPWNFQTITTDGYTCGKSGNNVTGPNGCQALQTALYNAVKADPVIGTNGLNLPVYSMSVLAGVASPAGLQCFAGPVGSDCAGSVRTADVGSIHFDNGGNAPNASQSLVPGGPNSPADWNDMMTPTWVTGDPGYSQANMQTLKFAVTEAGCDRSNATCNSGTFQADEYLTWFAAAYEHKIGLKRPYIDSLYIYSEQDYDSENFGFYNNGGTIQGAGTAQTNFKTILSDSGAVTLTAANVTLSGLPSNGHWFLTQKSSGNYELIAWTESGSGSTTFSFGAASSIAPKVYDPEVSTSAQATGAVNDTSITYTVPAHPIVVEFKVAGTSPPPPPPTWNLPAWDHLVVVWLENERDTLFTSSSAPYIVNTLEAGGIHFTADSDGGIHPSQPNYMRVYEGTDHGVTDDNQHGPYNDPDLWTVLGSTQSGFKGYVETAAATEFKHAPWQSEAEGTAPQVDASTFPSTAAGFATLPRLSFYIPNDTNSGHDTNIATADAWLSGSSLATYATWAAAHNSALLVITDESDGTGTANRLAVLYGASVSHVTDSASYTTYSILASICDAMRISAASCPGSGNGATKFAAADFGPFAPAMFVTTPGQQVSGTAFTLSGSYTGTAPTALDYSLDMGATWTAATTPTISGGNWSFSLTISTANPSQRIVIRNNGVQTEQVTTGTFAVISSGTAEALTASVPNGPLGVGVAFKVSGTITGSPIPTALQYSTNSGSTWTAASSPVISSSSYSFNVTINTAGTYTMMVRDTNHTTVTATSPSFVVSSQTALQQWSSTHKNTNFTLSTVTTTNDKVTFGGTNSVDRAAFGANGITTTGSNLLVYWELVPTMGNNNPEFGVGTTAASTNDGDWLGGLGPTWGIDPTGVYYANGASAGTISGLTIASGHNLGFALDAGHCKIWERYDGGNWNGAAIGSQNPATNTGGITLPTGVCSSTTTMVPAVSLYTTSQNVVAHFNASTFAYTPPSGFGTWDGTVQAPPTHTLVVTLAEDTYSGAGDVHIGMVLDGNALSGSPYTITSAHSSGASTTETFNNIADGTHSLTVTFTNGGACGTNGVSTGPTAWIHSITYDGVAKGVADTKLPCGASQYGIAVP